MNKLFLLFVIALIVQTFASDDSNFRTKDSSGRIFKNAMEGLRVPGKDKDKDKERSKSSASSKLKLLEEVLASKAPKKLVPSEQTQEEYDSTKFGTEMAELSKKITGDKIPSFTAPPVSEEEARYKESPDERLKRHRRQAGYSELYENLQQSGAPSPAAAELLEKLAGNPNLEKLRDDSDFYNRNPRPKFVPTVLKERAEKEQDVKQEVKAPVEEVEPEKPQLKPRTKRTIKSAERGDKASSNNVYQIQVGDYTLDVDVAKVKEFLQSPKGKVVQAVAAYFVICMVIRLLRLYKLLSFTRGLINLALFGAVAALYGYANSQNPEQFQVLVDQQINAHADYVRYYLPRVFGVLAVLNLFTFSRLSFADTLHFALVAGVGFHFKSSKLDLLEAVKFLPLYASAFGILSLLSVVSVFTSEKKEVKLTKEGKTPAVIVKESHQKAEPKSGAKQDKLKKRNKAAKESSEKAEALADDN